VGVVRDVRGCRQAATHGGERLPISVGDAAALAESILALPLPIPIRRGRARKADVARSREPMPSSGSTKHGRLDRTAKTLIDRVGAALTLLGCLPILAGVALLVRITLGRPIFFRQKRPGLGGEPFDLVKFRTMREGQGGDAERLTTVGRFLRSSSLDELPELWNVLRGEMSLVGPRPLLVEYLDRYTPEQARRHEMKPGLTGWAQVNGRNARSWDDKFALDIWYVDHWSLGLDLRILARTVWAVLSRRGVNAPGSATMPEFLGASKAESSASPEKIA
jgi:sugar transferase EpsL